MASRSQYPQPRHVDRRAFLDGAGKLAAGGLTGALIAALRPAPASAQPAATVAHAASAALVDRLRARFTFQVSVDVATVQQGLVVAGAAVAGGGFEARAVYSGGGNIVDFLALAGVDTAKAICAVRDEFRRTDPSLARLVFADILVPHQGPAAQAVAVARRMLDAGVDGVGVHLQSDARRADPSLIEKHYLDDMARAVFKGVGKTAAVQVVGGLTVPQSKGLAQSGLRAFVISGNMGLPDSRARYDLPPEEIQRHVAAFIAGVSGA